MAVRISTVRSARATLVLATLLWVPLLSWSAEPAAQSREQIERIVKEYLLKNPEIIRQAGEVLAAREEAAKQAVLAKALAANRAALERDAGSPVGGNPKGDVTVVEFFDYNCGFCKRVAPSVKALIDADKNVRVVYKEFPILGPTSLLGAKAALAAKRQGKYVAFHEALFELPEISDATIKELSARLGLDHVRLVNDMGDALILRQIETDSALARSLDINGTPGFVIGERLLPGAVETAVLQQVVSEQRLAKKSK